MNQKQVEVLIEAAKKTPIYLQVMFAVLKGLRRSEIIGVKYSDIELHQQNTACGASVGESAYEQERGL